MKAEQGIKHLKMRNLTIMAVTGWNNSTDRKCDPLYFLSSKIEYYLRFQETPRLGSEQSKRYSLLKKTKYVIVMYNTKVMNPASM